MKETNSQLHCPKCDSDRVYQIASSQNTIHRCGCDECGITFIATWNPLTRKWIATGSRKYDTGVDMKCTEEPPQDRPKSRNKFVGSW